MSRVAKTLLRGTLEVLILKTLEQGERHGYGIARWLEATTDTSLRVEEGSLYPALYRMEGRGWIEARWGASELGRKAKFYRLTTAGRQQLVDETARWTSFADAVGKVLTPT